MRLRISGSCQHPYHHWTRRNEATLPNFDVSLCRWRVHSEGLMRVGVIALFEPAVDDDLGLSGRRVCYRFAFAR